MKTVTAAQMRELDRATIQDYGISGEVLMERAGRGVADCVRDLIELSPVQQPFVRVLAGAGNNGGDAFVAARILQEEGLDVELCLAAPSDKLKGDALHHYNRMRSAAVSVQKLCDAEDWKRLDRPENFRGILVDGLLGTGARGAPRGAIGAAVEYINARASRAKVVAIDIPSGLHADTGLAEGAAVRADITVTMALPKSGLLMPDAVDYVGRMEVVDIGIPTELLADHDSETEMLSRNEVVDIIGRRRTRAAHKGNFGRVLVIGGAVGYSGAVTLAAEAALRSGAGLVTALVPHSIVPIVAAHMPEIMVKGVAETKSGSIAHTIWNEWERKSSGFDAILLGPGLTRCESSLRLVRDVLRDSMRPLVLDADAISVLEGGVHWIDKCSAPVVITPHPGEMARLLLKEPEDLQSARWDCAIEAAADSGATVVLKGAGTCIAHTEHPLVLNMNGNPGMATGGSGDVLGGLITALIAQGVDAYDAARAGVYIHGWAGDRAALRLSENGMIAGDLIEELPLLFQELSGR